MINSSFSFIKAIGLSHREITANPKSYLKEIILFFIFGIIAFSFNLFNPNYEYEVLYKILGIVLDISSTLFIFRIFLIDKNKYLKKATDLNVFYYMFRYIKSSFIIWASVFLSVFAILFILSFLNLSTTAYLVVGVLLMSLLAPIFSLAPEILILFDKGTIDSVKTSVEVVKDNILLIWFRSFFGLLFYVIPFLLTYIANLSMTLMIVAIFCCFISMYLDILFNRASVKMIFNLVDPNIKTDLL